MISDIINEALKNLRREGLRTFLTLLGIVIGIAAIISLLSIGNGLGIAVEKQLDELGGNTILVIPGGMQNIRVKLNESDIKNIESTRGVDSVVPIYATSAIMEFNGDKVNVTVNAVDSKKAGLFNDNGFFDVKEGRQIQGNDSSAILIGDAIANDYFEKKININKQIIINGEIFKVVGILAPQAQSFGGGPDTGNTLFMSLEAFRRISSSEEPAIIFVIAESREEATETAERIEKKLWDKYGDNSVIVFSSDQILEQVNMLISIISLFIIGLAGISLIVGGIGIMNAMFTSVIQRTREIGIYKAIGASNNKILSIFLLEAAFIGAIGGIIGILIGFSLSGLVALIGSEMSFPMQAVFSIEIIIGALAFSMIIGMLSGFYPALRAAKLDPVVALRYE